MKKRLIGLAALLCVSAMVACNGQNQSSSTSNSDGSGSASASLPSSASSSQSSSSSSSASSSSADTTVHVNYVGVAPRTATVYLSQGSTAQFTATVLPENATNKSVVWSSNATSIATVDQTGLVTCLARGTAVITATSADDETKFGEANLVVKLNESQDNTLSLLKKPLCFTKYESNTQLLDKVADLSDDAKAAAMPRDTFFENAEGTRDPYRVGDDNAFKVNVTGTIINPNGTTSDVAKPYTTVEISSIDNSGSTPAYTKLEGTELNDVVAIDWDNRELDFKDAAIGNQYRITVKADADMYADLDDDTYAPLNLDVEVVDGYNVYEKDELSLFDNSQAHWDTIKAAKGLSDLQPNTLVLHDDITLLNSDIPQALRYTEEEIDTYISSFGTDFTSWRQAYNDISAEDARALLVDSLKDRISVYRRVTRTDHENFTVEGNYFKIDSSRVKQIYAFKNKSGNKYTDPLPTLDGTVSAGYPSDGSHAQLFGINEFYYWDIPADFAVNGDAEIKNLTIIGNGDYSNDEKYMGGLITFKYNSVNFKTSNVNTSKAFTSFLGEVSHLGVPEGETKTFIDRSKCFNAYSSMLYIWGINKNYITNSIMENCGGAICLLDEANASRINELDVAHGSPNVDCYNCYLNNLVQGTEPWFTGHNAGPLMQMITSHGGETGWLGRNARNHGTHMNTTTIGTDTEGNPATFVNMIAAIMDIRSPFGNSLSSGGSMLKGHFNIYNDPQFAQLIGSMDMNKLAFDHPTENPYAGMASDAEYYVMLAANEANTTGNYLPVYRACAEKENAQGFIAATKTGHAMLYAADGTNGLVVLTTGDPYNPVNPLPFYSGNTEVAYSVEAAQPVLNGLASEDYLALYIQPAVTSEYIGVFLKTAQLDMGQNA